VGTIWNGEEPRFLASIPGFPFQAILQREPPSAFDYWGTFSPDGGQTWMTATTQLIPAAHPHFPYGETVVPDQL
jgi:hypothetical protein